MLGASLKLTVVFSLALAAVGWPSWPSGLGFDAVHRGFFPFLPISGNLVKHLAQCKVLSLSFPATDGN
jgi:hypothetical protein